MVSLRNLDLGRELRAGPVGLYRRRFCPGAARTADVYRYGYAPGTRHHVWPDAVEVPPLHRILPRFCLAILRLGLGTCFPEVVTKEALAERGFTPGIDADPDPGDGVHRASRSSRSPGVETLPEICRGRRL